MKKTNLTLISTIFILTALVAFKYDDSQLDKLLASLEKFTSANPQEKVHLHFDKPYYSLGEDMWFKAYVVNAQRNRYTAISQILYVDMIDDRDSVCNTLLLPMVNGMAIGNIHLSDTTLKAGNYHLYAYTKWMANYGSEYYFKKDIPVVNAIHGAINTDMQYKTNVTATGRQITAQIIFKKDNTTAIANQPVSYTINANNKTIADGHGTTDNDGVLNFTTLVKDEYKAANIVITANLTAADGQSVARNFVIKPLAVTADIQFFPEGGHLVNNIRTKVGFKALKPNGLSENVSGYVADEKNDHVAEFQSEHAGMGVFALMPLAGKTYTAVIKHEDGSEKRYPLPKADAEGYVLNINHAGSDTLSVKVAASATLANGKEVYIVAQGNGVVQFASKINMNRVSNLSYVSVKDIPTGILQFTLFSSTMQPLAERLTFIDHDDHLKSVIKPDKEVYGKRGKVNIGVMVTDATGQPVSGNFSVSVTDQGKVKANEDDETGMLSNLLLTSDIKGYIEKPNYYFNPQNTERLKHLDQLLLTQGWRRFNWADVQTGKLPKIKHQPEQGPSVSGTIVSLTDKPVPHGKVTLFAAKPDDPIVIDTVADENGHFIFKNLNFSDTLRAVVRATDAKDRKNVKIIMDAKPVVPFATPFNSADMRLLTDLNGYLKATQARFTEMGKFGLFKNAVALKEVKIVAKKNIDADKIIPNSTNLNPGNADKVITMEQLGHQTNLLNAFYGLGSVIVQNNKVWRVGHVTRFKQIKPVLKSGASDPSGEPDIPNQEPMTVYIDGAQVYPEMIKQLPASDVAGIEILTSNAKTAIYGDQGYWGVILITTKRGVEGIANIPPVNTGHITTRGYSITKEFYSPAYDAPSNADKMADLRSTIYWNPDLVTDVQGKTNFSYFNADAEGTYKITLEGMDFRGKLLRKTFNYEVK